MIRSGLSTPMPLLVLLATTAQGCITLNLKKPEHVDLYQLDAEFPSAARDGRDPVASLVVGIPRARPGFESPRLVYVSKAHQLQSFARSEWVDTPAHMLGPLLVEALERSGHFRSVGTAPELGARFRLDTEIVRLQQEFTDRPSRVRFTLDVRLLDLVAHRVLVGRELEAIEPAASDDPYGGVVAGNRAVKRVLDQVVALCVDATASVRVHKPEPPAEEPRETPTVKEPSAAATPRSPLDPPHMPEPAALGEARDVREGNP